MTPVDSMSTASSGSPRIYDKLVANMLAQRLDKSRWKGHHDTAKILRKCNRKIYALRAWFFHLELMFGPILLTKFFYLREEFTYVGHGWSYTSLFYQRFYLPSRMTFYVLIHALSLHSWQIQNGQFKVTPIEAIHECFEPIFHMGIPYIDFIFCC